MNHYIYAYVDPRDNIVRYIGQGQNERWLKSHKHSEQYGVYPWLKKLKAIGLEPLRFIVLEKLTKKQADRWEIDLIDLIGRQREQTGPLLNLSAGGTGGNGHVNKGQVPWNKGKTSSEETCRKISKARKGKPSPNKGKTVSTETRQKQSEASKGNLNWLGKKHSEESRRKMSIGKKGHVPWNKGKTTGQVPWNKGKKTTKL